MEPPGDLRAVAPWRVEPAGAIRIDGARQSGSGTLVRFAVALACVLGRPLELVNARARRPKPGLRPQHVAAVRACAELCDAEITGVDVDSRAFTVRPGARIRGGRYAWDIGTAGSATMLALALLPVAAFAEEPIHARITGGVFQDFAPSPFHLQHVLLPLLAGMGIRAELRLVRAGYVPRGAGVLELSVHPVERTIGPRVLEDPGRPGRVSGIAFASHLAARRVAERMAHACEEALGRAGVAFEIARVDDTEALHPGAGMAIWTETTSGCRLGADRAGALRRSAESIGRFVAQQLLEDLATGATVDRHLADQLVLFAALASGTTRYVVPSVTDHVSAKLWLAEQFGAATRTSGRRVEIQGIGRARGA
jgi:RNA 3'-terminal phosphate cyclase (ATP)